MKLTTALLALCIGFTSAAGIDYNNLPLDTSFPGPWEKYILAPANKSYIVPSKVFQAQRVTSPEVVLENPPQRAGSAAKASRFEIGLGGLVTYEFAQNIAGRVCVDVTGFQNNPYLILSYSESSFFVGKTPDATGDIRPLDLPVKLRIKNNGINCLAPGYNRGAFKYLTIYMPDTAVPDDGNDFYHEPSSKRNIAKKTASADWYELMRRGMKSLGRAFKKRQSDPDQQPRVAIKALWVICTSYPSQPNGRALNAYFDSSSSILNRIWYAGAWTMQLETIKPNEGCAIIQFSSEFDGTHPEPGAWYSNYTVSDGNVVIGEGAKRDRMVWPGDLIISLTTGALTTYDMLAGKNALDSLYKLQYSDGGLPYAGIPMGQRHEFSDTYHMHGLTASYLYVLYSGDLDWIKQKWSAYKRGVDLSVGKIDGRNLMLVTSDFDWIRPGMVGHNIEAAAIALRMLEVSIKLAEWVGEANPSTAGVKWSDTYNRLRQGIASLYCVGDNLFGDNLEERGCNGPQKVLPQDGNGFALWAKATDADTANKISTALRNRWTKYGAPAVEFPNVISPFASYFELEGHAAAGNYDAIVELIELTWGYMMDGPGMTNSTLNEGFRLDGYVGYPAYPAAARSSHAHGWSTGPNSILLQRILGIQLLTPLGKTWLIEPHLTKWLGHARGGFANGLGKFEVSIARSVALDGQQVQVLNITVPAGTSGTIRYLGSEINLSEQSTTTFQGFHYVFIPARDNNAGPRIKAVDRQAVAKNFVDDTEWTPPPRVSRPVGKVNLDIMPDYWVTHKFEPSKAMLQAQANHGNGTKKRRDDVHAPAN